MLLGAMENLEYEVNRLTLSPGEVVVIYSDGITEAMDSARHLYSELKEPNSLKTV